MILYYNNILIPGRNEHFLIIFNCLSLASDIYFLFFNNNASNKRRSVDWSPVLVHCLWYKTVEQSRHSVAQIIVCIRVPTYLEGP